MLRRMLHTTATLLLTLLLSTQWALCGELTKLTTAWLGEHETFLMWYAKSKGWDKEAGLDIEMKLFQSGSDILNALPRKEWQFAAIGAVPAMLGNLRFDTLIIGIANDESRSNGVVVPAGSPIAQTRGWNKDYPDLLGSPDTVRGKTFYVTTVSSAHYALSAWLNLLGLKDGDVVIKNTDQQSVLEAFRDGKGAGVALWSPYLLEAQKAGGTLAANLATCKLGNPIVLIAASDYAKANPDVAARFLSVYLRAVDMMKETPLKQIVPEYERFFREYLQRDYPKGLAEEDIKNHPVYSLEEQLALFDGTKGQSQAQAWQSEICRYYLRINRIRADEAQKVSDGSYATDAYLKRVR